MRGIAADFCGSARCARSAGSGNNSYRFTSLRVSPVRYIYIFLCSTISFISYLFQNSSSQNLHLGSTLAHGHRSYQLVVPLTGPTGTRLTERNPRAQALPLFLPSTPSSFSLSHRALALSTIRPRILFTRSHSPPPVRVIPSGQVYIVTLLSV